MARENVSEQRAIAFERLVRPAAGFVFDFDGFLADSEKYHYLAYREVFARHGHHVDEKEYYRYWTSLGLGARGEIERHGLDLDPAAIRDEKVPIFSRYCADGSIRLYDQALEMLRIVSRTGKKLAIASGTATFDIRNVLRRAGVADMFPVVHGCDTVPVLKPAPDVFLRALEELGLEAGQCVVFEDAEKGMLAANAAGIPVIVVRTRETRELDFSRADLTLDSHAELLALVRRLFSGGS